MYKLSEFVGNLNIQSCINFMGNCVHRVYKLTRFAENLNSTDTLN